MSNEIRFHPGFPADLAAALEFYDQISTKTGNGFRDSIAKRIKLIADNPELFAIVFDDIRITRIPRFPYSLQYRLINGTPKVLALLHTSRDRKNWPDRK